jgi:ribosome-associated protein
MSTAPRSRKAAADLARDFAVQAARIAADNKTENVRVLDLRGLSTLADYFVLGTGTSDRQMASTLQAVRDAGRAAERELLNVTDRSNASWLLADFVDVIVHLFDAEHREYYDLDGLWGDAPEVEWGAGGT